MDTGAIMAGLPLSLPGRHATTPSVVREVRDRESRRILENSISYGRLEVLEPRGDSLEEARRAARKAGVLGRLSETDLEVLALAIELGVPVATDDYALQLASLEAGVGFVRVRYRGVRRGSQSRGGRGTS
jgi:rRNA maturation endonuclease Nob1